MANWRCLFGWVKRLFTTEPKEKNPKKWRWCLGRFKLKKHPTITAATDRTLIEAKAEQRKHALTVAIATAAAAEAAVASANAAAEVVRLTGASRSYSYLSNGDRNLAAVKIQSAYRAHLARKALRALKGVVRLQAIVRGRAVRRRLSSTLKKLPSYARKQVGIQGSNHSEEERYKNDKIKQFPKQKRKLEEKEMKLQNEFCSQRTWNCSSHSREDIEAIWLRKQEAIVKRERMKQYSCSHREITIPQMVEEFIPNKEPGRESSPILGQWLHKERAAALPSDLITKEFHDTTQVAQRNLKKEDFQEYGPSSQISISRRSFSHAKRSSFVDDSSMPNSPVSPTYLALTESTKAKARSLSTPRQRTRSMDVCSNQSFPRNEGIPFWSSYYGATTSTNENIEASKERYGRVQNAISIIRRC